MNCPDAAEMLRTRGVVAQMPARKHSPHMPCGSCDWESAEHARVARGMHRCLATMHNNTTHQVALFMFVLLGAAAPAAARDGSRTFQASHVHEFSRHGQTFSAGAHGQSVPELDPSGAASALALLACSAFLFAERKSKLSAAAQS